MPARPSLEKNCKEVFAQFPWCIEVHDRDGHCFDLGLNQPHWYGKPLQIVLKTDAAIDDLAQLDGFALVERYLSGEVDLEGNLHILTAVKHYAPIRLKLFKFLRHSLKSYYFQNVKRARVNVKSHYDIRQDLLEVYLDQRYMAYSCAMFEQTEMSVDSLDDLLRPGKGEIDDYDSLEKAQWRKFKDAVDFIQPKSGETLLDVGCGYGGQLQVALENHPFGKVVGWTHSNNQVEAGKRWLEPFDKARWELNEGDYREDSRVYDHICSTGMVSHVGPRGLIPYVKNIRQRIEKGGRYVHHALMADYSETALDRQVGIAFNKKYVWPGFHWFTLGEHIKALEENGFKVVRATNLRDNYSKTITAWYERMMANKDYMIEHMGESTFRAWRLYLGGGAGPHSGDVNRVYCVAI